MVQVSLTEPLELYVKQKIASGHFHNESEVIREALRLMEQQEKSGASKLETLRELITVAEKQAERGEFCTRTVEEIIADNQARVKK